jgi:hypothetical protein
MRSNEHPRIISNLPRANMSSWLKKKPAGCLQKKFTRRGYVRDYNSIPIENPTMQLLTSGHGTLQLFELNENLTFDQARIV